MAFLYSKNNCIFLHLFYPITPIQLFDFMKKLFLSNLQNEIDEEFVHIYQLEDYPHIILQEIKGFCLAKEIKELHCQIIDLVEKHKFTHLISDIIEVEGSFEETNEWFINVFNPKMVELGMNYEAIIQSKNIFSKLAAEELVENSQLKEIGYHMRLFDSVEKALEWFKEEKILFPEKLKKANETLKRVGLPKEVQEELDRRKKEKE